MRFIAANESGARVRWIFGQKEHLILLSYVPVCAISPPTMSNGEHPYQHACKQYLHIHKDIHPSPQHEYRNTVSISIGPLWQNILFFFILLGPFSFSSTSAEFFLYLSCWAYFSFYMFASMCAFQYFLYSHRPCNHDTKNNIKIKHGWKQTARVVCVHVTGGTTVV